MKEGLSVYIYDDEEWALVATIAMFDRVADGEELVGSSTDFTTAIKEINQLRPELLIMDIEVDNYEQKTTSFDLLSKLDRYPYNVIFITGFKEYALQAIKCHALDYLLKPIRKKDLTTALAIARERKLRQDYTSNIHDFIRHSLKGVQGTTDYIWLSTNKGFHKVFYRDLVAVEADANYARFHMIDTTTLLVSKYLKEIGTLLPVNFFQIHRSYIINTDYVKEISTQEGDVVVMTDSSRFPVSLRRKSKFFKFIHIRQAK